MAAPAARRLPQQGKLTMAAPAARRMPQQEGFTMAAPATRRMPQQGGRMAAAASKAKVMMVVGKAGSSCNLRRDDAQNWKESLARMAFSNWIITTSLVRAS